LARECNTDYGKAAVGYKALTANTTGSNKLRCWFSESSLARLISEKLKRPLATLARRVGLKAV
jgi:hypothetical protein